jgi:hypothetical protein
LFIYHEINSSTTIDYTLDQLFIHLVSLFIYHIIYSSTTIDYTLDQLFIHLDDPEPLMQSAVLTTILTVAAKLDKELVS